MLCAWASCSVCVQARSDANRGHMCFKAVAPACCQWLDALCIANRQRGYVLVYTCNLPCVPCLAHPTHTAPLHTWEAALLQQQLMHVLCLLFVSCQLVCIANCAAQSCSCAEVCKQCSHSMSHCVGQLLAMRISQRTVAVSGGMLFLLFAAHNLVYGSHV